MTKIKVTGKGNISAEIIADSVSSVNGQRITTFVLEYHRYIHSEVMTHRLFSRNSASSRAIPVAKMIEQIESNPAIPIHWGKHQAGMQAFEECNNLVVWDDAEFVNEKLWRAHAYDTSIVAEAFSKAGYAKQLVNRLTEPFQMMKVVVTATSFDNFFWLRNHKDAQPEIKELARCMLAALKRSKPQKLFPGEWHVPFVYTERYEDGLKYYQQDNDGQMFFITPEQALKISASCCAQISYRKNDESLEKAESIWDKLISSDPPHCSPIEHQATPMTDPSSGFVWVSHETGGHHVNERGVTHRQVDFENDKYADAWSNNFKGWIQHRALIEGNVCNNYDYSQEEDESGLTIEEQG